MIRSLLYVLFSLFALFYIFFIDVVANGWHMMFKLIPMLILIALAVTTKITSTNRYKQLIFIGLVFCTIGDYTLQWFLVGLSSFLIGHLFYIAAFRSTNERSIPSAAKWLFVLLGISMALFFASQLLSAGETVLVVAVLLYMLVILSMGATSFRVGHQITIIGAILFIISDTILAFNRFISSVDFAHELIMLTYYGAQLCFVMSIAKYDEMRSKVVQ